MNFVDTHAHIYLSEFENDLDDVIKRIKKEGIKKIILPNIDSATISLVNSLVSKDNGLFVPLMGLHPTYVKDGFEEELKIILAELQANFYAGVGEVGIDLYWDKTHIDYQKIVFEKQVRFALDRSLPVIIHSRDAFIEVIDVLKKINSHRYTGIFHAFSGTSEQAAQVIEMGFEIGIGGVVTFKNSSLQQVVQNIDLNHIVLETDSPYLAPVPYRGKRNESSYIPLIAQKIAELKNRNMAMVAEITTETACKLFRL